MFVVCDEPGYNYCGLNWTSQKVPEPPFFNLELFPKSSLALNYLQEEEVSVIDIAPPAGLLCAPPVS